MLYGYGKGNTTLNIHSTNRKGVGPFHTSRAPSPLLVNNDNNEAWEERYQTFFEHFLLGHDRKILKDNYKEVFKQGCYLLLIWLKENNIHVDFKEALMAMAERRPLDSTNQHFYLIAMLNKFNIHQDVVEKVFTPENAKLAFFIACTYNHIFQLEVFSSVFKENWPSYVQEGFIAAAKNGHKSVLEFFFSDKVTNVEISSETLHQALMEAAKQGRKRAVEFLLSRFPEETRLEYATEALQCAVDNQRNTLVTQLINDDSLKFSEESRKAAKALLQQKRVAVSRYSIGDIQYTENLEENITQEEKEWVKSLDGDLLFRLSEAGEAIESCDDQVPARMFGEKTLLGKMQRELAKSFQIGVQRLFNNLSFPGMGLFKRPSQHPYLQGAIVGGVSFAICFGLGAAPLAYFCSFLGAMFYSGLIIERNALYHAKSANEESMDEEWVSVCAPEVSESVKRARALGVEAARAWTPYAQSFVNENALLHPLEFGKAMLTTMDEEAQNERASRMALG